MDVCLVMLFGKPHHFLTVIPGLNGERVDGLMGMNNNIIIELKKGMQ